MTRRLGFDVQVDLATRDQLEAHLRACDDGFVPALSTRVAPDSYAAKLVERSTRFEVWAEGRLVGLVAAYLDGVGTSTAFITNVSVLPSWRRRGLARSLLVACLGEARRRGLRTASLEVSRRSMGAIRLYQDLGFRAVRASGGDALVRLSMELTEAGEP